MLYQQATFTCPTANSKTTVKQWDLCFLSVKEFTNKYDISLSEYERIIDGQTESK